MARRIKPEKFYSLNFAQFDCQLRCTIKKDYRASDGPPKESAKLSLRELSGHH